MGTGNPQGPTSVSPRVLLPSTTTPAPTPMQPGRSTANTTQLAPQLLQPAGLTNTTFMPAPAPVLGTLGTALSAPNSVYTATTQHQPPTTSYATTYAGGYPPPAGPQGMSHFASPGPVGIGSYGTAPLAHHAVHYPTAYRPPAPPQSAHMYLNTGGAPAGSYTVQPNGPIVYGNSNMPPQMMYTLPNPSPGGAYHTLPSTMQPRPPSSQAGAPVVMQLVGYPGQPYYPAPGVPMHYSQPHPIQSHPNSMQQQQHQQHQQQQQHHNTPPASLDSLQTDRKRRKLEDKNSDEKTILVAAGGCSNNFARYGCALR